MDLRPSGFILPQSVLKPLDNLEPLPKLTRLPGRIATPAFTVEDDGRSASDELVADLLGKLHAEDERMRRILPQAPRGMRWEAEVQSQEPAYNFTMNRGDLVIRLVYKLKEA